MQVLGVLTGTLILWVAVAIDWPSILCLTALAFVPELSMNRLIAGSIGNSMFSFLLFTFACTYALSRTAFVRRCAIAFITNKIARKGSWWFATLYCLSILVLGLVMSPSVLYVIYMPIMETICAELKLEKTDKLANALALGQLFCCAIACGMTPIAHLFPLMGIGMYESAAKVSVGYASYMAFAIPVGVVAFIFMMLLFRFVLRPDMSKLEKIDFNSLKKDLKPMDKREKMTLTVFFAVVAMWVLPELLKSSFPAVYAFFNALGTTFPPMLGSSVLFILSADGEPLLNFKDVMSRGVAWGSVIMAAATMALGMGMTDPHIGLTAWLSASLKPLLTGLEPSVIVLAFILWAIIMTNACSNMVTVTVVCTVAIPVCMASGGAVNAAAVACYIGMLASYAFILPPAHPNVALAIGAGWTTAGQIIAYGTAVAAVTVIATLYIGYPIACALMPAV